MPEQTTVLCEDPSLQIDFPVIDGKLHAQIRAGYFEKFRGKVFIILGAPKSSQEGMIFVPDAYGRIPLPLPLDTQGSFPWRLRVRDPRPGEHGW